MTYGKHICEQLKAIRIQLAKQNNIKYEPRICTHTENCIGTCPVCEEELAYITSELRKLKEHGISVDMSVPSPQKYVG